MDVSSAEAKKRVPELIRAVENGEKIVIARHGKLVAQISPAPRDRRTIKWGAMRNRVKLLPGRDGHINPDRFLAGEL